METEMENTVYRLILSENGDNFWDIELLQEPFKGVVYRYGTITMEDDNDDDDGEGVLRYNVHYDDEKEDKPGLEKLENNPEFIKITSDVLSNIIENAFKTGDYRIGNSDTDTSKPDSE